jgi:hypothetical protein
MPVLIAGTRGYRPRLPNSMSAFEGRTEIVAAGAQVPKLTDTVEKVENRGAPKISRMSNVGDLSRCKALQYRCERRWWLLR